MQIKEFRTIPLLAALIGASLGTVVYLRSPALYASSSTIRLTGGSYADPNSESYRALFDRLSRVLRTTDARAATTVTVVEGVVRISHFASEANYAQDIVKVLVAAALGGSGDTVTHGTVVEPPNVATKPHKASDPIPVGAGVGLVLGGAFVMLRRVTFGRSTGA
jgi:hypothetical protein